MHLPQLIKNAIATNNLVVFAGSGLSTKFGLPTWSKMIIDVIERINDEKYHPFIDLLNSNTMTPIQVLELLKDHHNDFGRYIKDNFRVTSSNPESFHLHKAILALTGKVVTTNYDNSFEMASNNSIVPTVYTSKYNISEINKSNSNYIFKLHGCYTEPDHCIIFNNQYENIYNENSAAKEKLKSIFSEKTILFLGFSFNDPDINLIFQNLDQAFGNNNKHLVLTKEPKLFEKYKFLETLEIDNYSEIDEFINLCSIHKATLKSTDKHSANLETKSNGNRIAFLSPNPVENEFKDIADSILDCFNSIQAEIYRGYLNHKTLENLEDFDLIIIASKVFKSKLYFEEANRKSNLLTPAEICSLIPNDEIPITFITDERIDLPKNYSTANISSFKSSIIKRFVFKTLKEGKIDFHEPEISVQFGSAVISTIPKGTKRISSIYKNDKDLLIGKKCLSGIVGRIEEQYIIATGLLNIIRTNKLLNIKASGGTGKTTLIKKVGYELYNRGYFNEGVNFASCENIKSFGDLEELLIEAFNLTNIIDFKGYLIDNYSNQKLDLLIILDNFETVVNTLNRDDLNNAIELLKFATDYANIVVTSREKISSADDFEDVYSLPALTTDDAMSLFQRDYGAINNKEELQILRRDILEELLNNNPLAIKLVTKSRTRLKHISELREQLKVHFFESINEDFTSVFNSDADLNIERTKSIFQSINYSYTTLNSREKIAFELLSLFPDGISLSNFKKCFSSGKSKNQISDNELRVLRNKSLVEDYNGILQLQPIIRRFADYQFNKRSKDIKNRYCSDAYSFNCYILELIDLIEKKKTTSEALRIFNNYKNNLLAVLDYIPDVQIPEKNPADHKKYMLNYIYGLDDYIHSDKQIQDFTKKIDSLNEYFSDVQNAEMFVKVIALNKVYFHKEFDHSYRELTKILPIDGLGTRVFENENYVETRYKNLISNIHSMEGNTIQHITSYMNSAEIINYLDAHFFYLGVPNNISRNKDGFYFFEYELMFNRLNVSKLQKYINSLFPEEHLEIMQSTYTLSKVLYIDKKTIQKLVVTNPYTRGLKYLMFAFASKTKNEKIENFEHALANLSHIKYYYLEALYYYCIFLRDIEPTEFKSRANQGIELSNQYYYQYLNFLFKNLLDEDNQQYVFSYSYYPLEGLEEYVKKHNTEWEKRFKKLEN